MKVKKKIIIIEDFPSTFLFKRKKRKTIRQLDNSKILIHLSNNYIIIN